MNSDSEGCNHVGYDYKPKEDDSQERRRIMSKTLIVVERGDDSYCRGHILEVGPLTIVGNGFDS